MPYAPTTWVDSSSPDIDATNLNNIETGISKAPYGADASANQVAIADGSGGWTYAQVSNAQIASAAAIAYSKLALAGSIVNADIATGAALAYAKMNLAGAIKDSDIATSQNISKLAAVTGTPDGTKFLRDDGAWIVPAGLTTYRKTTAKVVNNTVTATDLLNGEITVAANAIGVSGMLRFTASGDWKNNNALAVVPRFVLKLGTTTLIDTSVTTSNNVPVSANRYGWRMECTIQNLGAANSQWATMAGRLTFKGAGSGTNPATVDFATGEGQLTVAAGPSANSVGLANYDGGNAAAVDTTASQLLSLAVILPVASTNVEMKLYHALVEIV